VSYDIQKCAAFQFCHNENALFFSDSIQNVSDKRYQYNVQPHDRKKHIKNTFLKLDEDFENDFLCKKGDFIFFQNEVYKIERARNGKINLVVNKGELPERGVYKLN
jgi:uncharacterized protein involved in outer membrane biogenesis